MKRSSTLFASGCRPLQVKMSITLQIISINHVSASNICISNSNQWGALVTSKPDQGWARASITYEPQKIWRMTSSDGIMLRNESREQALRWSYRRRDEDVALQYPPDSLACIMRKHSSPSHWPWALWWSGKLPYKEPVAKPVPDLYHRENSLILEIFHIQ